MEAEHSSPAFFAIFLLPCAPIYLPLTPDAKVYAFVLILALVSSFLFGIAPVRQVLKTDPYWIVKAGSRTTGGQRDC